MTYLTYLKQSNLLSAYCFLTGELDVVQDGSDLDCFLMTEDIHVSSLFIFRPPEYRKLNSSWMDFFSNENLTDDEFREHFRVSQVSFLQLYV
jgi:hypothetical protein